MLRRSIFVFVAVASAVIARAAEQAPIRYTLSFAEAAAHYVDVEAEIPTKGKTELVIFMPVWTPGSYFIREYARNIVALAASRPDGQTLGAEKITKNRWQIATGGAPSVRVKYRVYAREINVRGNWVESDHALLNGAPTFISVVDDYQRPYVVRVILPERWKGTYTPLLSGNEPHTYSAPDFDTLVDSPILAGSPLVDSFEVDGVPHYVVTLGGEDAWDNPRVTKEFKKVVEAQRAFWGQPLPLQSPYYVFNILAGSRGGLEHRNSTVLAADRWLSRTQDGVTSWLSLASHEYFHVWNGKRLRPVEYGPFDYEKETYSKSLWAVEGLTSYYQHVFLARAGFYTREQYLGAISGSIAGAQKTPGRFVQSLGDASFDAWVKAYRPDENSVNALFSYYGGGSIAGLLFDAEIQRATDGKRSLADVMRAAYARYSGEHGYTEAEFLALTNEITGQDFSAWFTRVLHTPGNFDYQPMLDWYGLEFEKLAEPKTETDGKKTEPRDPPKGWLGADTANREGRLIVTNVRAGTPAAAAGLSVDDEILAVEDYRVRPDDFVRRLTLYPAGATVKLLVARQDRLLTLPAELKEEPKETWKLKVRADASKLQKSRLDSLLGIKS